LIDDIVALTTYIGDTSRLAIDPEVESYQLASILLHGAELCEFLAQARGIGVSVATTKSMSSEQFEKLTRLIGQANYLWRQT